MSSFSQFLPYFYLILAISFWSGNFILGRYFSTDISPLNLAFWRWIFALGLFLPFTWKNLFREKNIILQNWWKLSILGILSVGLFNTLIYTGLQTSSATNAFIINATAPIFIVILLKFVIKDKFTVYQYLGVFFSMTGATFIIIQGDFERLKNLTFQKGDLWILGANIAWSCYSIGLKTWKPKNLSPNTFLLVTIITGNIFLSVLQIYNPEPSVKWNFSIGILLLYLSLFASIAAYLCWNEGVRQVGPQISGQFLNLVPLIGVVLSTIFLKESLEIYHWTGSIIIGIGLFLGTSSKLK